MQCRIPGWIAHNGCASTISVDRFVIEKAGDGVNPGSCVMDGQAAIRAADGDRVVAISGNGGVIIKSVHRNRSCARVVDRQVCCGVGNRYSARADGTDDGIGGDAGGCDGVAAQVVDGSIAIRTGQDDAAAAVAAGGIGQRRAGVEAGHAQGVGAGILHRQGAGAGGVTDVGGAATAADVVNGAAGGNATNGNGTGSVVVESDILVGRRIHDDTIGTRQNRIDGDRACALGGDG